MPRPQADEGLKPYEIRPGIAIPRLKGMNRNDDPAGMPPNAHHLLVNARIEGGEIRNRAGSSEEEDSGNAFCITGMIEITDVGVGLWIFQGSLASGVGTQLGNFNEQASPAMTYHIPINVGSFIPCRRNPFFDNDRSWETLVRYRKKMLNVGLRNAPNEQDESTTDQRVSLFEIGFPVEEGEEASSRLYLDLTLDNVADPADVRSMCTRMTRIVDVQSGDDALQEQLLIGTANGRILSYDGSTLTEELDLGANYSMRLITHNGIGVFAIGSDGAGTAVCRYQAEPGAPWDTITLPAADMHVTDLRSWGGKVYVCDIDTAGTPTRGARIYVWNGEASLGAHDFEFPWTSTIDGRSKAGLFFEYRGSLHAVAVWFSGFSVREWYIWRRDNDSSWTDRFPSNPINMQSDYEADVNWFIVTGSRVIWGGMEEEEEHVINEVSMSNGNLTTLHNIGSGGEEISTQALVHSPDDTSLDEEEV